MNRIFKVIYSKTKHMYVVASELAKSHSKSKNGGVTSGKALAALVMAALASVSFMAAPLDVQAADKTDTTGWQFIGIWHNSSDESNTSENYQSHDLAVNNSGAMGEHSITIGVHTQAGPRTIVIGDRLASTSEDSVFIGSGYDANNVMKQAQKATGVVVIGSSADATGTGSIALGYGATADPWKNVSDTKEANANKNGQSIAFGYKAQAENNNIAIGANSVATDAASTTAALYTSQTAAKSYVSVGTSSALRRITNVADGAADTDVATIAQLKQVAAESTAYTAGWGIDISTKDSKNTISLKRDLGTDSTKTEADLETHKALIIGGSGNGGTGDHAPGINSVVISGISNKATGEDAAVFGGNSNTASGHAASVTGGANNEASGQYASVSGGWNNTATQEDASVSGGYGNTASGARASISGGNENTASGFASSVSGGESNTASGKVSSVLGGFRNTAAGERTTVSGGQNNIATSVDLYKLGASVAGGSGNTALGENAFAAGGSGSVVYGQTSTGIGGGSTGEKADHALAMGAQSVVTVKNGTAVGYQATADEEGTIAFGHDKGDVSRYRLTWQKDANGKYDYTKAPTVTEDTYDSASYNRLVKVADGKDDHDVVVMEQLKPYTKVDASNIGANLKKADGTAAEATDVTKNKEAWATAIGTGTVTKDDDGSKQLVTGGTVYAETHPTANGNYIKAADSAATNLSTLDAQVHTNATNIATNTTNITYNTTDITNLKNLSNITDAGETVIKNLAKGAVKVTAGNRVTVDSATDKTTGTITYTVSANNDGKVEKGNTNLVSGDTVNTAINSAIDNAGKTTDNKLAMKADVTADNIGKNLKDANGNAASAEDQTANEEKWGEAIGTGSVASGDKKLVTGGTVYNETHAAADGTYHYINAADSAGKNLTALDSHVYTNETNIATNTGDIKNLKNLSNITDAGETVIKNLAKGAVKVTAGNRVTVDSATDEKTGTITYTVSANNDGKVEKGNTDLVSGDTVNTAINSAIDNAGKTTDNKLAMKADVTADNIGKNLKDANGNAASTDDQTANEEKWGEAIGTGTVASGDKKLVTGGTVYDALHGGLDSITVGKDGQNGKDGSIGIAGKNGKDGYTMTIIKTEQGAAGVDGKDGITRVVYQDKDGNSKHTFATLDDGLKFKGDDGKEIAKKLNNTLELVGGADSTKLTDKNIGVNNVGGKLQVQLAKDLTGISSISNQTTTGDKTTGAKIELGTDGKTTISGGDVSVSDNKITNIKAGDVKENSKDAVNGDQLYNEQQAREAADTTINNKIGTFDDSKTYNYIDKTASISTNLTTLDTHVKKNADDISNINTRIDTLDGNAVKYDDATKSKITLAGSDGTTIDKVKDGTISATSKEAVNGSQMYTEQEARKAEDTAINNKIGSLNKDKYNYIDKTASVSDNLDKLDTQAKTNADAISKETQDREAADKEINDKIGSLDKDGNYIKKNASISQNLNTLDGQVNTNATNIANNTNAISKLNTTVNNLSDNAVQYDKDSNKGKITLAGQDGTTITNVKDGSIAENSKDAVNGGQLYNEQTAREKADTEIRTDITKIKDGEGFTDKGKTVIKSLAQDAVDVVGGDNVTVTSDTQNDKKTFTVKVDGNGKVASGDKGLISGDTIYNELRPSADGSYIKKDSTTGQNLTNLDNQVKKNSDLINSDGKTIKIGGSDTATKIDVSDKDGSGRTITGVVTDGSDASSAANVGYVNDVAAANTQQIYRDMNSAYGHLNNNINKAAAGSNALAALHPLDYDPADKASYAVGYGHYRNANAAAVGAFYQPNANTMVSVGVSMGNGDPGVNAGVSFKVGKGSTYNGVSKAQMAETIAAQEKQISEIKASDAAKDQRIDTLEKENQEMKKQIQEILAKLGK